MGKIQARVAELRQPVVEAAQVTLEGHLQQLADIRDKALANNQFAAATSAEHYRGKAAGLYVERTENVNRNFVIYAEPEAESTEEWARQYGPKTP